MSDGSEPGGTSVAAGISGSESQRLSDTFGAAVAGQQPEAGIEDGGAETGDPPPVPVLEPPDPQRFAEIRAEAGAWSISPRLDIGPQR